MYKKLLSLRRFFTTKEMSKTKLKRINLLLLFSLVWILQAIISVFFAVLGNDSELMIKGHIFNIVSVSAILFLLYKKKYEIASVLFMLLVVLTVLLFTNFIAPRAYGEYHYLHISLLMLVLTDNKILIYSSFIISYIGFALPNKILGIYPETYFADPFSSFIFFLVTFLLVYFFKVNNLKNEKLLEEKQHELEALNNFQSQFFINISHEIRTPLTLIKGEVDKLKEIPSANRIEQKLNNQIDRIKNIVDDVIDLSKMDNTSFKLNLKTIDLKELVSKVFVSFQPLFYQKNITFKCIHSSENYFITADEVYLERAINNLVLNAYKYTEINGVVSLKIAIENNQVLFIITDSGIGIPKQEINKIFDRFYQVDNDINKSGGSGVGLSFSKEIIELHKAKIEVNSQPNIGTTIQLFFPFANGYVKDNFITETNPEEQKNRQLSKVKSSTKKVLIVDDSYEMRKYLKEILFEYTCIEAVDGLEALSLLKKPNTIDLVISDYMMPKMNGLELLKNIKLLPQNCPVLMLTARTDYKSKLEVLKLGVTDYLHKPFEKEELLIRVKNILKQESKKVKFLLKEEIPESEVKANSAWIEKLKTYIKEHCSNPKLNQEEIAENFNLSKSSFYRKVKMETGLTPNGYITEIKLQEARNIVESNHQITLKELAYKVGYLHTSYFVTKYEKRFGKHPLNK